MAPKVCVTKLKKEMKVITPLQNRHWKPRTSHELPTSDVLQAFLSSPPPHIPAIFVNERNMLGMLNLLLK